MKKFISFCSITVILSLITIPIGSYITIKLFTKTPDYEIQNDIFTEKKLIIFIKDLRLKFPHIILAQAKIESGGYKSFVFKNNNNLFGMRHPRVRVTTSRGSKFKYAYYNSWRESVIDYAFFSIKYIKDISSEEDYYKFLGKVYAEDPMYVSTIKNVANKIKSKNIF